MNQQSQEATVTIPWRGIEYEVSGIYEPGDPRELTYGVGGKPPVFHIKHINVPSKEAEAFLIDLHGNEIADLCIAKLHERR